MFAQVTDGYNLVNSYGGSTISGGPRRFNGNNQETTIVLDVDNKLVEYWYSGTMYWKFQMVSVSGSTFYPCATVHQQGNWIKLKNYKRLR